MPLEKVSVIGAGAWGTALANHIASLGKKVTLWAYEKDVVDEINNNHRNSVYLEGADLSPNISATNDLAEACEDEMVFFVAPSHVMERIISQMVPNIKDNTIIVSATKGIENEKLRLPSQVFEELMPPEIFEKLVCLSGPSFAKEVAAGLPTAITAASRKNSSAVAVQELMSDQKMRIYTHDDVIGAEIGGSIKNIIAIAAGVAYGLELGNNARAALVTRGLAEMTRFGKVMGARENTFTGLSGLGDLILTAMGDMSRNRTVGARLGAGETLDEIVSNSVTVAEGVKTSRSVYELSERYSVEMPLCTEVYRVCHENKNPRDAVRDLMGRKLKEEFDE